MSPLELVVPKKGGKRGECTMEYDGRKGDVNRATRETDLEISSMSGA
jgi:hypothetical protein